MSTEQTFKAYKIPHFTVKALEATQVTPAEILALTNDLTQWQAIEAKGVKPKTLLAVARKMGIDEVICAAYEEASGLVKAGTGSADPVVPDAAGAGSTDTSQEGEAPAAVTATSEPSAEATPQAPAVLGDPAGGGLVLPTKPAKSGKGKAAVKTKGKEEAPKVLTAKDRISIALAAVKRNQDDSIGETAVPLVGTARSFIESGQLHAEKIPTRFPAVNVILDGGIPRGRFTVVAGPEQSCKSTFTQCVVADDQQEHKDGVWLWLDAEHSFDAVYAEKNGIDLDRLILIQPDIMEQMCQRAIEIVVTGAVRGLVVDSVGGFTPWEELKNKRDDKDFVTRTMADNNMAALAKRIGQFFRMMNVPAARTKTACVLIGHVYTPIGDMYGPEYVVKGGNALKHWSHVRLMMRRKKGDQTEQLEKMMPDGTMKKLFTAYEAVIAVDKTRQGAHYAHEVSIPYVYGTGLSNERSIIDMAFAYNIISAKGAWYGHRAFPERTPGKGDGWLQGRETTEKYILNNPEVFSEILKDVGAAIAAADAGAVVAPAEDTVEETHVV